MKIGVYCGSFAPVHLGHIGIIEETLKEGLADKVIVVASSDYWNKKVAFDINTRLECLKLYANENIIIDEDPVDLDAPYTYVLLNQLSKKYPDDTLCLMLGADNLVSFSRWKEYEYLLNNYPFIVMNRDDLNTESLLEDLHKKDYAVLNCDNFDVSSTYIRENIDDYKKLEGLVDTRVLNIINRKS